MSLISILDGAMGTEIIAKGIKLPNFIWSAHTNLQNPSLIYDIHKKYIDAGSDFITTNTFRTTTRSYMKTGFSEVEARNKAFDSLSSALEMAHKARENTKVQILGSIAPLEDCYSPLDYPGKQNAEREILELSEWLVKKEIDIFILETMNNLAEILVCLKIISGYNIPIWLSLNILDDQHILSGESISEVIAAISGYSIDKLLLNCNSIADTLDGIPELSNCWSGEWGVYPNLGLGKPSPDGVINEISSDDDFLDIAIKAIDMGATVLGGCCGSNAKHIQLLSEKFK